MFTSAQIDKITLVTKAVLARRIQNYVRLVANQSYSNNFMAFHEICNIRTMFRTYRYLSDNKNLMLNDLGYQQVAVNLYGCISAQPEYSLVLGGGSVISANVIVPSGVNKAWVPQVIEIVPASGVNIIPVNASDQMKLISAIVTNVMREGIAMQSFDNTRPDYYSFNSTNGQITITTPANGQELFRIEYSVLQNVS